MPSPLFALATLLIGGAVVADNATRLRELTVSGSVAIGQAATASSKAVLELVSTAKGFLPPRMTGVQRDAITSPPEGLVLWNTTSKKLNGYNGSSWGEIGGGAGGIYAGGQNLISNNSFETDTTGWTASGGTFARTTTNGQFIPPGVAGASWDSGSASQTLSFTSTTVNANDGLFGRSGVLSCAFRCASGTCTHKLQAYNGSGAISEGTITSSTTNWYRTNVYFSFPSGTVTPRVVSAASDEPALYMDDCYFGLVDGFNVGNISQAELAGQSFFATTANCSWARTNTAMGAFGTNTDCPGPTVSAGYVGSWQTTDADLPQQTINSLPPGRYKVTATFSAGISVADNAQFAISDGTNTRGNVSMSFSSTSNIYQVTVIAFFEYTDSGNRTFAVHGSASSGTVSLGNNTDGRRLTFTVEKFPNAQETGIRTDQTPSSWSGFHDTNCTWTSTSPSMGDLADDATCTFTESTNRNFGTVSSVSGTKPGLTFTPSRSGRFFVKVTGSYRNTAGAGQNVELRLVDGSSNIIDYWIASNPNASAYDIGFTLSGIVDAPTANTAVTAKIQGLTPGGAGTLSLNGASKYLRWSIYPLDQGMAAPHVIAPVVKVSAYALAGTFTSDATVTFDQETDDTDAAWSGTTFTAPRDDTYHASFKVYSNANSATTSQWFQCYFFVNGAENGIDVQYGNGASIEKVVGVSKDFKMAKGQTLLVKCGASTSTSINATNHRSYITIHSLGRY